MRYLLIIAMSALMLNGCSITKATENTLKTTELVVNWDSIKRNGFVSKLRQEDRAQAQADVNEIDKLLTFLHQWEGSDSNARKKLVLNLPSMRAASIQSFSRLHTIISKNLERFTEPEISVMKLIYNSAVELNQDWNAMIGNSERVQKLANLFRLARVYKDVKELNKG